MASRIASYARPSASGVHIWGSLPTSASVTFKTNASAGQKEASSSKKASAGARQRLCIVCVRVAFATSRGSKHRFAGRTIVHSSALFLTGDLRLAKGFRMCEGDLAAPSTNTRKTQGIKTSPTRWYICRLSALHKGWKRIRINLPIVLREQEDMPAGVLSDGKISNVCHIQHLPQPVPSPIAPVLS